MVGDSAHGFPGLPGWARRPSAAMLFEQWDEALLYRRLTTLRVDAPTIADVDEFLVDRSAAGVRGMVGDYVRARQR